MDDGLLVVTTLVPSSAASRALAALGLLQRSDPSARSPLLVGWERDTEARAAAPSESGSAARRAFPAGSNSVSLVLRALVLDRFFAAAAKPEPSDLRPFGLVEGTWSGLSDHFFSACLQVIPATTARSHAGSRGSSSVSLGA